MDEIVEFIQLESLKIYKKKYSKKYIKLNILPIVNYIELSGNNKFLVGGSQGIGKSSLVKIIKKIIEKFYSKKVLLLSLDDYYLSKSERTILGQKKHKLLTTRGVPGTHNIKNLIRDIKKFEFNKYPLNIPIFDKLVDDKLKKIRRINQKCDVLILEGWCCGCTPINNNYLKKNLNFIEKTYDKNLKWRKFYNSRLKGEYKELFQLFDKTIYLKAPSFNYVISWRGKQEKANNSKSIKAKKMNSKEIKLFIQHYEKITKWMLKNFKEFADLVIKIDKDQIITSVIKK